MKISANFALEEFLVSRTAKINDINMTPPKLVVANLHRLVLTCLQPIREALAAPVVITSGYRPTELNELIGGSPTSAHQYGRAADFYVVGYSPYEACEIIREMPLEYDQLINEFQEWIHLGIAPITSEPRVEDLTAKRKHGRTVYEGGIQNV